MGLSQQQQQQQQHSFTNKVKKLIEKFTNILIIVNAFNHLSIRDKYKGINIGTEIFIYVYIVHNLE